MQTRIHPSLADLPKVREADSILRKCVHCGFCTATCPTYQLLGDELDGPRGRIYLIKNLLETDSTDEASVAHLDRCLTCRSCETTCPSGVEYGRLLDIGREFAAGKVDRPWRWRLLSRTIRLVVPRRALFSPLLHIGQWFRPLVPRFLSEAMPRVTPARHPAITSASPRALLLTGCVQGVATPNVNASLQRILDHQGMTSMLFDEGCCGALDYHLSAHEQGKARMRRVIDGLHARIDDIDHIVSSATGCGVTIRDYPAIFADEPDYHDRAVAVTDKLVDPVELIVPFADELLQGMRVSVHTPCSMQHGMKLTGRIEQLLRAAGADILPVRDGHICCGSAGTYSIMQPELSRQLQSNKLTSLNEGAPDVIVTANVGCQLHLEAGSATPVMHWAELIADQL